MAAAAPSTILVTGASGFVGHHTLPALRSRFPAARLIATARDAADRCPGADETVVMNLLDPEGVEAVLGARKPDAILHLAAQAAVGASFAAPAETWQVNLFGTLTLAEAMLRRAPDATLVFASSAETYGLSFRSGVPLAEEAAFAPANPYAASKAAADIALGEMALRGLKVLRMRPFNQIGPGQTEAYVVAAFARQVARIELGLQEPTIRTGALDRWRDMIDVRDVAQAYAEAIARADGIETGTAINLATGHARRVGDILEELIRIAGIQVRVETDPGRLRPTDVIRTQGDTTRAAQLLGWRASIPWAATLALVLEDWRARARNLP